LPFPIARPRNNSAILARLGRRRRVTSSSILGNGLTALASVREQRKRKQSFLPAFELFVGINVKQSLAGKARTGPRSVAVIPHAIS